MLQFNHYTIRYLELTDLTGYYDLVANNRNRLQDYFAGTISKTLTLGSTEDFIKERIHKRDERVNLPYVIVDEETKNIIGFIDVKNIDWRIPKGELGCYLDEKYAGKGIGSKAFSLFIQHCFDYYKFVKLILRTHESNAAARNLAEKCGFIIEGTIRNDHITTSGQIIDLLYYGKINCKHAD